jgi:hypothetical protein
VDVTNPDGSTDNATFVYHADGTFTGTDVTTPAGGSPTTTVTGYDDQHRWLSVDVTNPDGSTDNSTYVYNADGTFTGSEVKTPAGGGPVTTTISSYDAQAHALTQNTYTPSADGSYTDTWAVAGGPQGSYWWNSSTREYQENWYNSDGTQWTDNYQYAAGGSPGSTGYSFTESYTASDGSHGTRQFDASSGVTSLGWDSATSGPLSGTTTDAGFIGLQKDGELTNTQPDPTFFNPTVSPGFNAFLTGHG